jgi:hypothetical protein
VGKIINIYQKEGLSKVGGAGMETNQKFINRAQMEMEKLIGPDYRSDEFMMVQENVENYLKFLAEFKNLSPEEKEKRISRAKKINEMIIAGLEPFPDYEKDSASVFDNFQAGQSKRWGIIERLEEEAEEANTKESSLKLNTESGLSPDKENEVQLGGASQEKLHSDKNSKLYFKQDEEAKERARGEIEKSYEKE